MRDASPIGRTSIAREHSVNRSVRVGVIRSGGGEDHGPFGLNAGVRPVNAPNAQLKSWRILCKLRCCPWRAERLAKAIQALQAREMRR